MFSSAIFMLKLTREAGELAFETRAPRFRSKCCLAGPKKLSKRFAQTGSSAWRNCRYTLVTLKRRSSSKRAEPTHSQKLASYPQFTSATSDGSTRQTTTGECDEY